MQQLIIVAGSTARTSITPTPDPLHPTVESVTFFLAQHANDVSAGGITIAESGGVYTAVIPSGTTAPENAGEEWVGAFVIRRSGSDGEQVSRVAVRVFIVLADTDLLVTLAQAKGYLRVDDDSDDALIELLIAEAQADLEGELNRPIATTAMVDRFVPGPRETLLRLKGWPLTEDDVTLKFNNGAVFTFKTPFDALPAWELDRRLGTITSRNVDVAGSRIAWPPNVRVEIAYTGGLSTRADYESVIKPRLAGWVLELTAGKYANRNPRAISESDQGASHTLAQGMPRHIADGLKKYSRRGW